MTAYEYKHVQHEWPPEDAPEDASGFDYALTAVLDAHQGEGWALKGVTYDGGRHADLVFARVMSTPIPAAH